MYVKVQIVWITLQGPTVLSITAILKCIKYHLKGITWQSTNNRPLCDHPYFEYIFFFCFAVIPKALSIDSHAQKGVGWVKEKSRVKGRSTFTCQRTSISGRPGGKVELIGIEKRGLSARINIASYYFNWAFQYRYFSRVLAKYEWYVIK